MGEIAGELAPDDHLLQKRILGRFGSGRLHYLEGQPERRDLPEVQVGAHAGGVVGLGLVWFVVPRKAVLRTRQTPPGRNLEQQKPGKRRGRPERLDTAAGSSGHSST
jgi:hypothetical protein